MINKSIFGNLKEECIKHDMSFKKVIKYINKFCKSMKSMKRKKINNKGRGKKTSILGFIFSSFSEACELFGSNYPATVKYRLDAGWHPIIAYLKPTDRRNSVGKGLKYTIGGKTGISISISALCRKMGLDIEHVHRMLNSGVSLFVAFGLSGNDDIDYIDRNCREFKETVRKAKIGFRERFIRLRIIFCNTFRFV